MNGYLQLKGWWRIVNRTITRPVAGTAGAVATDEAAWDNADEMALGAITLKLAYTIRTGMVAATLVLTWTALQTAFAWTGVSAVYQDFKAAMRVRVGSGNPAKDITRLSSHLEHLRANQVVIPNYVQGMMLLNAIPDEWDHITAHYTQTTQAVANVTFAAIRTAIMAEHDHLGGTKQNQSHIADKLSEVKRKGKSPKFSNQQDTDYAPASNKAGPSSSKRRRGRGNKNGKGKAPGHGQGSHHHSHLASQLEMKAPAAVQQQQAVRLPQIALQPSRAGPTTTTIASFKPAGINYMSKPTNCPASTFTGQPSRPGLATLPEAHSLAERLEVTPTIGNLKALNALHEHRKHVEKSCAYTDALAAVPPPTPSTIRVEEVPDVVMKAATLDKRPKKMMIMKVGLPLDPKGKGKAKEVTPPVKVSNSEEQLDWGSNDDVNMGLTESAGIHQHKHSWHDDASNGDVMDSVAYDHIAPQVPFLSIGLIGSLIIESSQGQLRDGQLGRVDSTPFCVCKLDTNTCLSTSSCTECEKCKQSATGKAKGLV